MIDNPLNRLKVRRGSALPQAKLDEQDVRLIRLIIEQREQQKRRLREVTNAKLAEKFGVHVRTIDRISVGEGWGHVE